MDVESLIRSDVYVHIYAGTVCPDPSGAFSLTRTLPLTFTHTLSFAFTVHRRFIDGVIFSFCPRRFAHVDSCICAHVYATVHTIVHVTVIGYAYITFHRYNDIVVVCRLSSSVCSVAVSFHVLFNPPPLLIMARKQRGKRGVERGGTWTWSH